ncbi:Importin N-terminal domain-containing protein [Mycena indigotica]|uniref:Importin N-terminal domain-containing protein n=1 Tax=Mycena indigotica TaxID=2126181 RepID=A0A8H6S9P3_9AGAR|nr:Importin N-terminal domain-containing protein [Mycena indigotica]KAF7294937.1 Importin N-terminal domain-containing protein [Mycena indigotica]
MEALLDFSRPFDVSLLDRVASSFYTGSGQEQQMAQLALTQFEEHPDSWTRVPEILEKSEFPQSKFIGLQILERLVTTRWKTLPEAQRQGIRNFIVGETVKVASDDASLRRGRTYLSKLNLVLVQVLKQEWPHNWPNFISELVQSSTVNLSLCENNMAILKLLSEEIFDFSEEQMTQSKTKNLKNQMSGEFSEIFKLCSEVLKEANKSSLIRATLETLLRFLNWIPLGYIFETQIIDLLLNRFLESPDPQIRNVTLNCLASVAGLEVGPEYDGKFVVLFSMTLAAINRMLPPSTDIASAYAEADDAAQQLILNLALFLTSFLSAHLRPLETPENQEVLLNAHMYLVKISQVEEREVFKICLEYWTLLVAGLYDEVQATTGGEAGLLVGLSLSGGRLDGIPLRKDAYAAVLSNLRLVMIARMAKPEEVLVVENDEGEIVREFMKEGDTLALYKAMRIVLVYLTHLDVSDTETILSEKLAKQVDGSEWSWQNINSLCWAIGSISGTMSEEQEKRFLVTVIKELLGLVELKRGKDNKAVIASDIMYIVQQYPRFLKAHWKFLKTVVNKLFEFMHEKHEGVQDMACDTFIKIAQKCRRHFVIVQSGETEPFVDEILRSLSRITVDLSAQQVHTFYQAVGTIISAQPNKQVQERLISGLMELPNNAWDSLMAQASQGLEVLNSLDNVKVLSNVLKTNVSACESIGTLYLPQLARIFVDMLGLYKTVSATISESIAQEGAVASKTPRIRQLRAVKKDVLKLMETYIQAASDLENVNTNFIPLLLDAILGDYNSNIPVAREAEVLHLMAVIVKRMASLLTLQIPATLDAVFQPTLDMINRDFTEFPEHRTGLYKLLREVNLRCFPALLGLQPAQFKLFMDSIMWAIKHTVRDIADMGLTICLEVVNNFASSPPEISGSFFSQFFINIVQDILFVLTDADHKSGFKLQITVLARMFELVDTEPIPAQLFDPSQVPDPSISNLVYLKEYTDNLLRNAFGHVLASDVHEFVDGLATHHNDPNRFKLTVRDFLIQTREFSSGDNAELYRDDKEAELKRKEEAERQAAMQIPGMLKPSQLSEDKEETM